MAIQTQSNVSQLFMSACAGSNASLGKLLTLYGNYLKLLVSAQLDDQLRGRVSASDVVQESFLEAHRDFNQFRGQSPGEFVVWLRRIVVNNILRMVEQHVLTEKRDVRREVSMEEVRRRLEQSTVRLESLLAVEDTSPSKCAVQREDEIRLADTLAQLPADYREVIVLRHIEALPFEEVGRRMGRSSGAVRMLWLRALKQLRDQLGNER